MDALKESQAVQKYLVEYIKQQAVISEGRYADFMQKFQQAAEERAFIAKTLRSLLMTDPSLPQTAPSLPDFSYSVGAGAAGSSFG
jgi:hypothetical protein